MSLDADVTLFSRMVTHCRRHRVCLGRATADPRQQHARLRTALRNLEGSRVRIRDLKTALYYTGRLLVPGSTSLGLPVSGPIYGVELLGWISDKIRGCLRGCLRGFIRETSSRAAYYFLLGFE